MINSAIVVFCDIQADEVEALTAIYGNDWCVEDAVERRFSINVSDGSSLHQNHIQLQVNSACAWHAVS